MARSSTSARGAAIHRGGLALLGVLLLALSGGGPPASAPPAGPTGAFAATLITAPEVARVLGRVNPTLQPGQLERISTAVIRYSSKYGLDPELVTAIILVESSGRPEVRSPKGAMGLMQVMPYMHTMLGLVGNLSTLESNIEAGCVILAGNIRRLGEDDGISAYFWGSDIRGLGYLERVRTARSNVRRWLRS